VAVLAGLVANFVAASYGYLAPFILAIAPLSMCFYLVHTSWPENYGDASSDGLSGLQAGFNVIRNDYKVAALGLGQVCRIGLTRFTRRQSSSCDMYPNAHLTASVYVRA
jgi:hypothetical protein